MYEYQCQGCGDRVTMDEEVEPWECVACGEPVVPIDDSDVIATDDLQELQDLIEEWRTEGIPIHPQNPDPSESAGRKAAAQLEQRIDDLVNE